VTLEGLLPQCPIHREIEDKNLTTCDLIVYGIKSNDCTECKGTDNDCQMYNQWRLDYLIKQQKGKYGREDGKR